MARVSYAQLEGLWIQAGGSPSRAPLMAAIAMAESGGNPDAKNPSGATGLWQILGAPEGWTGPQDWTNPGVNAKAAVMKYDTQGLGAWTTYTNGQYKLYLRNNVPPATQAELTGFHIPGVPSWLFNPFVDLPGLGILSGAAGTANPLGIIGEAEHILADVGSAAWWSRIGKGAIGGVLILGGVYLMMRKEGYQPVKTMVTAGKKVAEVTAAAG